MDAVVEAVIVEISKLELGPDDVLVVRTPYQPTAMQLDNMSEALKAMLGQDAHFIFATTDIEFSVVKRTEGEVAPDA